MWSLLAAAPAFAVPYGLAFSAAYDLPGGPGPGAYPAKSAWDSCDPNLKTPDGAEPTRYGCKSDALDPGRDTQSMVSIGVGVPVLVPLSSRAALRVEPRGAITLGYGRLFCARPGTDGGKSAQTGDPAAPMCGDPGNRKMLEGEATVGHFRIPSLTVSAGPDVRLSSGEVAPHVATTLGVGLQDILLNSNFFAERALTLQPTVAAAALFGVVGESWFVDLGYAASVVGRASVQKVEDGIEAQPFVVNGPRLDVGLRFGAAD